MSETSKKFVEKLLKTSATVAVVSAAALGHVAKAEELTEEVLVTTADTTGNTGEDTTLTIPEAEAKVAVAQADAVAIQADVAVAQADVAAAQADVAAAQVAVDAAQADVAVADAYLQKVIQVKAETTPAQIQAVEEQSIVSGLLLEQARQVENETTAKLNEQTTVTESAQTDVAAAQADVAAAEAQIAALENVSTNSENLDAEKALVESQLKSLAEQLKVAQDELAKAKQTVVDTATADIAAKEAQIQALEAQIASLQAETTPAYDVSAIVGNNKIVVPSYYANQLSNIRNYNSLNATQKHNLINLGNQAAAANGFNGSSWVNNGYQTIAGDTTRSVNVNDAKQMAELQTELTIYTAELLNQARRAFNLNDLTITDSSLSFANAIAAAYLTQNGPFDHTRAAHNTGIINAAATAHGLTTTGTWYENVGSNWPEVKTVNDLKKGIHSQLLYMLFTDSSSLFGHTQTFLKSDSTGRTYLGVAVNGLDAYAFNTSGTKQQYNAYTQFYEVVNGGDVVSSAFNTTPVSATQKVDNSARVSTLQTQINALKAEVAAQKAYQANPSSHPTVVVAQNKVDTLASQQTTAQNRLTTLTAEIDQANQAKANFQTQLTAAQAALATAQANLAAATATRDTEQATLETLKAELAQAVAIRQQLDAEVTELLDLLDMYYDTTAEQKLSDAETKKLAADEQLLLSSEALLPLQAKLTELEAILADKLAILADAEALLAALVEEYEGLLVNRDEEGVHAVLDENLTADELPVFDFLPGDAVPAGAVVGAGTGAGLGAGAGNGSSASFDLLAKPQAQASGANVASLTNTVLAKAKSSGAAAASQVSALPNTGDKSSLVAAAIGAMMLSGAALKGYKRPEEN